jgi:hypothetical protein
MNQDTKHESESVPPAMPGGTQVTALPDSSNVTPPNNDASRAIIQCLIIAAQRGQQIRLAREQATQLRQSKSMTEEIPQSDEI